MDFVNSLLNLVVPPASLVMLAFAWPTLCFIRAVEWAFRSFYTENMEDKVVIITGASSGIGERGARRLGAQHVMIMAADVVKEDDCRRFIGEVISYYGRVDHLVNTASLGHSFFFEEAIDTSVFPHLMDINFWGNVYPTFVALPYLRQSNGRIVVNASIESWLPLPRMSLYTAAKAAIINFYETLRFEVKDEVGITIATHGWIGSAMTTGKFMLEEGLEMQWKEEREANVLRWTFRLLLAPQAARVANHAVGTSGRPMLDSPPKASGSRPMLETSSPRSLTGSPPFNHQQKVD
ncbi:hypothetical protein Syun_002948 [Stephania yunnanensis]|uniref:11-beta-hydroxysteroid dehydrogenase-like 5 n=1 Tax=Stephania yunnanensis TaxID=152371 RepID=A0AAP0L0H6_9MAGN